MIKKNTRGHKVHDGACSLRIAVQINNRRDHRAIEIIVDLGTFSFKDQPIKVRLEVFARVVLLRIRGTRM